MRIENSLAQEKSNNNILVSTVAQICQTDLDNFLHSALFLSSLCIDLTSLEYYMEKHPKMENENPNQPPSPKAQTLYAKTHNIIATCDNSNFMSTLMSTSSSAALKKKSKLPAYVFDPHQPNPQDQSLTEKYVEKLKNNARKKVRQPMIRKSELGENQMVFTQEEYMKLEVIDQFVQKGFDLPEQPYNIELYPTEGSASAPRLKYERINSNADNTQKVQDNKEEIENFQEWGQLGNKEMATTMLDGCYRPYIEGIDMGSLERDKKRRRKQYKNLNFTKIKNRSCQSEAKFKKQKRSSLQEGDSPDLERLGARPTDMGPQLLSQFDTHKYIDLVDRQKFPSFDRLGTRNRFNPQLFKQMQMRDKITQLTSYMNKKYSKMQPHSFLTSDRIQALYNCQVIRGAKQMLSRKDYANLKFEMGVPEPKQEVVDEQEYYGEGGGYRKNEREMEMLRGGEEIEKVLVRNRERLRAERQRVIEKLRC